MNALRHIVFLWGISWIACFGLDAAAAEKPNVLFIAVDDLNDWIGALGGHPDARTPNIDRLAARGVLFTRAYTAAPACNPSRAAALLTGIRPSTSGVYNNHQPWKPVMPDVVTLPQFFKDQGYHVAGSGKIFHERFMSSEKMTAAYLDYSESWHEFVPKGPDIMPEGYPVSGIPDMMFFDWGPLQVTDDAMDDHRVVSLAIQQLNKRHEKPLFLASLKFHIPDFNVGGASGPRPPGLRRP